MNQALQDLGDRIASARAGEVERVVLAHGELTLWTRPDALLRLMQHLRDDPDCLFKMLVDICGVDYPDRAERFEVVYHLLSLKHNLRVRVKVATTEEQPVPSVTGLFKTAGWFEREAWDLYGILFADHPDLRRILTDYGFHGHPLRKDFPMTGYVEVRYDDDLKRVVYEPVKSVEFRSWDFLSPWEGAEYAKPGEGYPYQLPGDEKAEKPA